MNDKAFLDINALKSVDHIRKIISQYREQQEQLLNKISPDINRTNHQHIREQNLERLFDHCCVIGVSRNSGYLLGSWPLALIGSFSSKTITLGSFESHGSLWRFVRVDDNHGSLRVVIECSVLNSKTITYYLSFNSVIIFNCFFLLLFFKIRKLEKNHYF